MYRVTHDFCRIFPFDRAGDGDDIGQMNNERVSGGKIALLNHVVIKHAFCESAGMLSKPFTRTGVPKKGCLDFNTPWEPR